MKPDTHTFWDPEKGRYVTIPLAIVIKPPTNDDELRRKSVVAVDAVVSSAMNGIMKEFLWALGVVAIIGVLSQLGPVPNHLGNVIAIGTLIVVALRLIYLGCRKLFRRQAKPTEPRG